MAIVILMLYTERAPIYARLGQIIGAEPGFLRFEVHFESDHVCPLHVPADWVQLKFWERILFGRCIHTPKSFAILTSDAQSEANVPIAPTSHAISRLRPSISMFELNVHAPQED
jgi:hypothetical protein